MDSESFWVLKVVFGSLASIFAIAGAAFAVQAASQEKHPKLQDKCEYLWNTINSCFWMRLPELVIIFVIEIKKSFPDKLVALLSRKKLFGLSGIDFLLLADSLQLLVACSILWKLKGLIVAIFISLVSFPVHYSYLFTNSIIKSYLYKLKDNNVAEYFLDNNSWIIFFFKPLLWLYIATVLDIYLSAALMFIVSPLFIVAIVLPFSTTAINAYRDAAARVPHAKPIEHKTFSLVEIRSFAAIGFGVGIGFFVTLFALLIGHAADPSAYLPQTIQMLVSNVIFDGLTLAATFLILELALRSPQSAISRIFIAVVFDLLIAALFAVFSLYLGLLGTGYALSIPEVLNVLIMRSPSGDTWSTGPYFWAMHTAFIPTAVYIFVILISIIAKAMLIPWSWFFGKASALNKPHALTSAVCGLIFFIFSGLSYGMSVAEETKAKHLAYQQPVYHIEQHSRHYAGNSTGVPL